METAMMFEIITEYANFVFFQMVIHNEVTAQEPSKLAGITVVLLNRSTPTL
jgi:hypothetical protein